MRIFGAQLEGVVDRLPPDVKAFEVLLRADELVAIGSADFETCIRKVNRRAAAAGLLRVETLARGSGGVVRRVIHGVFRPGDGRSAEHAADALAAVHRPQGKDERAILKIADPDGSEAFVVGPERSEKGAAHDGQMRRDDVVALQIGEGEEGGAGITGLRSEPRRETLREVAAALDQETGSDGSGEQRRDDGNIRGVSAVGIAEESHSSRDEWNVFGIRGLSQERGAGH